MIAFKWEVTRIIADLEILKRTKDISEETFDRLNQALIPLRFILLTQGRWKKQRRYL